MYSIKIVRIETEKKHQPIPTARFATGSESCGEKRKGGVVENQNLSR